MNSLDDPEDIVDDYDFILVTERYMESLVVLRHILGVSLPEMLFLEPTQTNEYGSGGTAMGGSHVVSLSAHSQRFLDVIVSRNRIDRKLFDAANVYLCPPFLRLRIPCLLSSFICRIYVLVFRWHSMTKFGLLDVV